MIHFSSPFFLKKGLAVLALGYGKTIGRTRLFEAATAGVLPIFP
jgi:hypothetical protein